MTPVRIHVIPVNDLREHEDIDCWCYPTIAEDEPGVVVVHNAMDGREAYETGERKPS